MKAALFIGVLSLCATAAFADPKNIIIWEDPDTDIVKSDRIWEEGPEIDIVKSDVVWDDPEVDIVKDNGGEYWEGGPAIDVVKGSASQLAITWDDGEID